MDYKTQPSRIIIPRKSASTPANVTTPPLPTPAISPLATYGKGHHINEADRARTEKMERDLKNLSNLLGPLEQILREPDVSDIHRNPDGAIWICRVGKDIEKLNHPMDDSQAMRLISAIAAFTGAEIGGRHPILLGTLPGTGSRFSAVVPPVARPGPLFSIRKHAILVRTFGNYIEVDSMTESQAMFLRKRIRERDNFLIVGSTGSGKALDGTTLVYTPTGKVPISQLRSGDRVLGGDGNSCRVLGVYPQGPKEGYRVGLSDGCSVVACDEHLWKVESNDQIEVLSTHDLRTAVGKQYFIPSAGALRTQGPRIANLATLVEQAWQQKTIPEAINWTEASSRRAFLAALLAVPLEALERGFVRSLTKPLPHGIQTLVRSLGGLFAPIAIGNQRMNPILSLPAIDQPGISRRIVSIEPTGQCEMVCIAVDSPDQCFVIEGEIVTHNTTFANAMLREVAESCGAESRIAILEDTAELQCPALNSIYMLTDDQSKTTMNTLLETILRLSPDRIIIGELRGKEAATLIEAYNTGHKGGLTTIHSENAASALIRMETLVRKAGIEPHKTEIAAAIQTIIVIQKEKSTGKRSIQEIRRIGSATEREYYLSEPIS